MSTPVSLKTSRKKAGSIFFFLLVTLQAHG